MKVVWTQGAADDLESIVVHIRRDSPDAARRVAKVIFDTIMSLPSTPFRGRRRTEDAGREIVFTPWPYIAVYEVVGEILYVKAVRHTSRSWDR
jgi:plasmid stabilization system protein ParE